jgi:hypothetical protein
VVDWSRVGHVDQVARHDARLAEGLLVGVSPTSSSVPPSMKS